jgi:hypothetical protein
LEIKIKKIDTQTINGSGGEPDITEVYSVVDNGKEFQITLRTHAHGSSLSLAGKEGVLYTDRDSNMVRRQIITVGRSCGITIDADELVEGLSVLSIRGIIRANRTKETREITLIVYKTESGDDQPVVLIDGQITDLRQCL